MTLPIRQSIKSTLQFSIVVFSLLLTLCFILLMLSYAWIVEDNVFNRLVITEARHLEQAYDRTGQPAQPRYPFMSLYPDWQALPVQIQALHQRSPERIEFPNGKDGTLHIQSLRLGEKEWLLAANVSAFEVTRDFLPRLVPYLALALVLVAGLALALSYYLSDRIIRPLQSLSRIVEQHRQGMPFVISDTLPDNEIGYLGQKIQSNIKNLEGALAREADFTRDISHELRTPVTIVKMILNRLSPASPPDKASLVQLRQSVEQMEQIIHALLALAREESMQRESLCLLEAIEHCLVNNKPLMLQPSLQLQLLVPADYRIVANKNLLHILLSNCIENALRHASACQLTVQLADNQLCISNPSDGHSPADALAPGAKRTSSQGIDQGLHIVNRICQSYHWPLASYVSDGKFCLKIEFPAST